MPPSVPLCFQVFPETQRNRCKILLELSPKQIFDPNDLYQCKLTLQYTCLQITWNVPLWILCLLDKSNGIFSLKREAPWIHFALCFLVAVLQIANCFASCAILEVTVIFCRATLFIRSLSANVFGFSFCAHCTVMHFVQKCVWFESSSSLRGWDLDVEVNVRSGWSPWRPEYWVFDWKFYQKKKKNVVDSVIFKKKRQSLFPLSFLFLCFNRIS